MVKKKVTKQYYKDPELLIRIGENIRKERLVKGLSIEMLANEIGIDYSQLNRMELGKVNFSISYLYRIAKDLKIDAKKLLP